MSQSMTPSTTQPHAPEPQPEAKSRWYLRPWFIVPAALAIAAAAALAVLFSLPKTITVHGRIVDTMRPDVAVAAATVQAGGKTATTSVTGAFTMTGVPHDAKLQVTAPAYRANAVSASTQQMTIRLIPVPVKMSVTSAMTGTRLSAAISAAPGAPVPYTVASDGALRLYRAAPGQTLTVKARGYLPAHARVTSSRTLTAALEPTAATVWRQITTWDASRQYTKVVDWVLRPAIGYTFVPPTAKEQAQMNKMMDQYTLYYTVQDIAGTSAWVEIAIDTPSASADTALNAKSNLGRATKTTIVGRPAWHGGPDSYGTYGTLANPGVIELGVYGDSIAQTDRIMSDILRPLSGHANTAAA